MNCKIVLDTENLNIFPGSTISGIVHCNFEKNLDIREIKCTLKGREKARFNRGKTTYQADNVFLLIQTSFRGEGTVPSGIYQYPFTFIFPPVLPSSFETKYPSGYGDIKYSIKAVVDIPYAFDYKDKVVLKVNYPIDLNIQPGVLLGNVSYEWQETISSCCFNFGEGIMKVTLQGKNAYVPGEIINMFVEIKNFTNSDIQRLMVTLTKVTQCKNENMESYKDKNDLLSMSHDGVGANSEKTYSMKLQIPKPLEIYNFVDCRCIKQDIRLRVEAVYPLCYDNLVVDINLIVGHIPLNTPQSDVAPLVPYEE